MRNYAQRLYILLQGFECHPNRITEIVEIKPDRIVVKGQSKRPGAAPAKLNGWFLDSGIEEENSDIESQWSGLKSRVSGYEDKLMSLPAMSAKEVKLVVYGYKYIPEMILSKQIMSEIVSWGFDFEVVVYDLSREE